MGIRSPISQSFGGLLKFYRGSWCCLLGNPALFLCYWKRRRKKKKRLPTLRSLKKILFRAQSTCANSDWSMTLHISSNTSTSHWLYVWFWRRPKRLLCHSLSSGIESWNSLISRGNFPLPRSPAFPLAPPLPTSAEKGGGGGGFGLAPPACGGGGGSVAEAQGAFSGSGAAMAKA